MTVGELKKKLDEFEDLSELVVDVNDEYVLSMQQVFDVWKYGDKVCISCAEDEVEEEESDEDDSIDRAYDDWLDDRMEEMYGEK